MGELVHVRAVLISLHNLLDVRVFQRVLVLAGLELLAGVDEQHVAAVAVALGFQHQQAHGDARSMEQVRRKSDDRIQTVQVLHDVLANDLLGTTTEQHTVGQEHRHTPVVVIHVIDHVLDEGIVRMGLGRQLAGAGIARVIQQRRVPVVLQGIGRVAHLYGHLHVAVLVLPQRAALVNVEVLIINAVHQHVHTGEVVRRSVVLLSVEVPHASRGQVLLNFQQHGRRTAGTVAYGPCLVQTHGRQRRH